jgi:hypothetical protein
MDLNCLKVEPARHFTTCIEANKLSLDPTAEDFLREH